MASNDDGMDPATIEEIVRQALLSDQVGISEIQSIRMQTVLLTHILGTLQEIAERIALIGTSPKAGE